MVLPRPSALVRGLAIGGVSAALLGCAATTGTTFDTGAAAVLADRVDRLAELLDEGDHCQADTEVDALRGHTREREDAGEVPDDVAREVLAVLDDLEAAIACDDAAEDDPDADDDGAEDDPDADDDAEPDERDTDDGAQPDEGDGSGGGSGDGSGGGSGDGSGGGRDAEVDEDRGGDRGNQGQGRGRGRGDDPPGRGRGRG